MRFITFRRHYLDQVLTLTNFYGKVLDVGGKKENKRGSFRPPLDEVKSWEYLNVDKETKPDYYCSAAAIPVDDNTFDIVLMSEVLEHLENPEEVLSECYRVLKKGGTLILTVPFLYAIHADPYDFQRWTDVKLKLELDNHKFLEITISPMGSIFAVMYDLLYSSLTLASKNSQSFRNRFIRKFILPVIAKVFNWLDNIYIYKSQYITTGYYVKAKK